MEKNFQWWLVKIDRFGAWLLLATVFLFFVTSYGMEKGIINSALSRSLHFDILPLVGAIAFIMHTGPAIRMSLMRWRIWNKASRNILILIYAALAIGFIYVHYFYQKPKFDQQILPAPGQTKTENTTTATENENQANDQTKTFTLQELAKYDGKNGNPAYVAVDGTVYDVSTLFINGRHRGCSAGQDVTAEFYDEHSKSILSDYPIMGTLR
jgi:predicted heme/steroid binding protein